MVTARWFSTVVLAAALVLGAGLQASAEIKLGVDEKVGSTQGWTIAYNTSIVGCLAVATYKDGTTVWFGLGKDIGPYIAFTNASWTKIEVGKSYELRLQMRGHGGWRGNFSGLERGNEKGLITTGVKAQFFGDFARAGGISVSHGREQLARLDLLGSRAALVDVLDCQKSHPVVAANPSEKPAARSKEKSETSGTGFFVSTKGHILTNHHVVNECTTFRVARGGLANDKVRLVASDEKNDLAVLATDLKPEAVPSLRTVVRMGESISVYGFPLAGLLASTGNFTTGTVTALAGLGDDTRMIQISAPVQPGNSGGPLIDQYGNVVGVIVSKLNALRVAKATDDLPQNINFAIKSVIAQSFLESNDILPSMSPGTVPLDAPQVAERAKAFTVRITCK